MRERERERDSERERNRQTDIETEIQIVDSLPTAGKGTNLWMSIFVVGLKPLALFINKLNPTWNKKNHPKIVKYPRNSLFSILINLIWRTSQATFSISSFRKYEWTCMVES